jgi:hypothetical protein
MAASIPEYYSDIIAIGQQVSWKGNTWFVADQTSMASGTRRFEGYITLDATAFVRWPPVRQEVFE